MARLKRYGVLFVLLAIPFTLSCMINVDDPRRLHEDAALRLEADPNEPVVYVGRFGNTYHTKDCDLLKLDVFPLSLPQAKRFYSPCTICKPPQ
jgi:hypothetical protein